MSKIKVKKTQPSDNKKIAYDTCVSGIFQLLLYSYISGGIFAYLWHIFPRYTTPFAHSNGVVIRTNSASTSLTIDAAQDTVSHFGSVGSLNIKAIKGNSYHEHGKAAFAEIKTGRIVLEEESEIKHIHVNANDNATGFEAVVIADNGAAALPSVITRDEVTVATQALVVTVEPKQGNPEQVYVYASGTTGTTEKTSTQNTSVDSPLGQLVLDNGSNPGEKAQNSTEKAEAKAEVIDELAGEEIAEENQQGANYVARIGATGYETFKAAVEAANEGEKIYLLKDFTIGEDIGELSQNPGEGWIGGLHNEVVLSDDITITFVGSTQLHFHEGSALRMNNHQLSLYATSNNAGLFLVEIDGDLEQAIDESGAALTLTNDIEYIQTLTLSNFVRFYNGQWEKSSQIGVGGAGVGGFEEGPEIWG